MNAEPTPPANYPREGGSPAYGLPLQSEGPRDFFPPVCLQSHWDPTAILQRVLPNEYVAQPLDPRPWTRVCMEYTTAGPQEPAPAVDPRAVLPSGGQFYPPGRYQAAIDAESQLRRLDRPLGTCEADQWEPHLRGDMFESKVLVPKKGPWNTTSRVQELAYPKALLRSGPYECRFEQDQVNMALASDYIFNNATKQDRYKLMKKETKPGPPEGPLRPTPSQMRPDLVLNADKPEHLKGVMAQAQTAEQMAAVAAAAGIPQRATTA